VMAAADWFLTEDCLSLFSHSPFQLLFRTFAF
jgi:hypothetical protein